MKIIYPFLIKFNILARNLILLKKEIGLKGVVKNSTKHIFEIKIFKTLKIS